jgi:hypothetical protein
MSNLRFRRANGNQRQDEDSCTVKSAEFYRPQMMISNLSMSTSTNYGHWRCLLSQMLRLSRQEMSNCSCPHNWNGSFLLLNSWWRRRTTVHPTRPCFVAVVLCGWSRSSDSVKRTEGWNFTTSVLFVHSTCSLYCTVLYYVRSGLGLPSGPQIF